MWQASNVPEARLGLLCLLKSYPHLGRFPGPSEIPVSIVEFLSKHAGLAVVSLAHYPKRTRLRHQIEIRQFLGVSAWNETAAALTIETMQRLVGGRAHFSDLINGAIEALIAARFELPLCLEDLLLFENTQRMQILDIEVSGHAPDYSTRFTLELESKIDRARYFTLAGNEEDIARLRQNLLDCLDDAKPWYSFFATANQPSRALNLYVFLVGIGILVTVAHSKTLPTLSTVIFFMLGVFAMLFLIGVIAVFTREFFPILVITVGKGKARQTRLEVYRQIWIALILAIVVSAFFYFLPSFQVSREPAQSAMPKAPPLAQ